MKTMAGFTCLLSWALLSGACFHRNTAVQRAEERASTVPTEASAQALVPPFSGAAPLSSAPCPPPLASPTPDVAGPWISFFGAGWEDGNPSGGPQWKFAVAGLPAISKDGSLILVDDIEPLPGDVPTLTLLTLRADDESVASKRVLLGSDEFSAAYRQAVRPDCTSCTGPDVEATRKAYSSLRRTVAE